jgi:hypothetical protein
MDENLSEKRSRIEEKWFELGKNGVRYFICVTAPYNYITCIDHNLWGVEPHNQRTIKKNLSWKRHNILYKIRKKVWSCV